MDFLVAAVVVDDALEARPDGRGVRQVEVDDRDVLLELVRQHEARRDEDDILRHEAALQQPHGVAHLADDVRILLAAVEIDVEI